MLTTAAQTENKRRYNLPLRPCCVHGDDTDNPRKTYHYENPAYAVFAKCNKDWAQLDKSTDNEMLISMNIK